MVAYRYVLPLTFFLYFNYDARQQGLRSWTKVQSERCKKLSFFLIVRTVETNASIV